MIDWKNVSQLADAMKDPDYNAFILEHLKSPEAKDDAPDVYSRAKANCPKGLEAFCKDIAAAVHEPPAPPPPTPAAMPPIPRRSRASIATRRRPPAREEIADEARRTRSRSSPAPRKASGSPARRPSRARARR